MVCAVLTDAEGCEMENDEIDLTNRELDELNREVIARGGQL